MDRIQESLNQMMVNFNNRLDNIELQLPKSTSSSPGDLAAEFHAFKSFVLLSLRSLQCQIGLLANQADTLEMRTRRKILLLHGIPEEEKENTPSVIAQAVVKHLKLEDFKATDISRCHRMGTTGSGRPRPILCKLGTMEIRNKMWSTKTKLKGSGITLSEFLTKARHDVFLAARQRFGISKCWTREGYVYVLGADGNRYRVHCIGDLDNIASKSAAMPAVPTKVVPPVKETTAIAASSKPKRTAASKKQA